MVYYEDNPERFLETNGRNSHNIYCVSKSLFVSTLVRRVPE